MQPVANIRRWLKQFHQFGIVHEHLLKQTAEQARDLHTQWRATFPHAPHSPHIRALDTHPERMAAGKEAKGDEPHIALACLHALPAMAVAHRCQAPLNAKPLHVLQVRDVHERRDGKIGINGYALNLDLSPNGRAAPYAVLPAGSAPKRGEVIALRGHWSEQTRHDGRPIQRLEAQQVTNLSRDPLGKRAIQLSRTLARVDDVAHHTFPPQGAQPISYERWWERIIHALPRGTVSSLGAQTHDLVQLFGSFINQSTHSFPHPLSNGLKAMATNLDQHVAYFHRNGMYPESPALAQLTPAHVLLNGEKARMPELGELSYNGFPVPIVLAHGLQKQMDLATRLAQTLPATEAPEDLKGNFTLGQGGDSVVERFRRGCHLLQGAIVHTPAHRSPQSCWLAAKEILGEEKAEFVTQAFVDWADVVQRLTPELLGKTLKRAPTDLEEELREFQKSADRQAVYVMSQSGLERILNQAESGGTKMLRIAGIAHTFKKAALRILDVTSAAKDVLLGSVGMDR